MKWPRGKSTVPSSTETESLGMKCSHCSSPVSDPTGRDACVNGVDILILACPGCRNILGVVSGGYSGYLCN